MIGTSAVCVCSTNFEIWTRRDGAEYYIQFKDGIPQSEKAIKLRDTEETGSTFQFTPDKSIFSINGPAFDYERIKNELELTSYFIPGATFELIHKGKTDSFLSQNGLKDFAKNKIVNPLHSSYIYGYKEFDDEVEIEVFAQWTSGKEKSYIFSNGALNIDGGTPETGAKASFTRTINSISKGEFDADMIRKGLVYIVNIRHPHPIYQNQTKSKIQNSELRGYTQSVFTEAIKEFVTKHKDEFDKIVGILTKEKKAEAAAERARQQVLNNEKEQIKAQKAKILNVDKLCDARKLGQDSILLLTEGLSAGGSMKIGRDANKYGILMLKGKCKNLLNCTIEEGLQNEEVKLFQQALGIIYGRKVSLSSLRYGKIAIASDSDFDGSHVGLLIMAMTQVLCPELIKENRLFWLRAPIAKVETKTKTYFYYSEDEMVGHPNGEITFFKGLGQMNEQDLKLSMFSDEWQRLEPINFSEEGVNLLEDLMGPDIDLRKEFVYNNIDFSKFNVE